MTRKNKIFIIFIIVLTALCVLFSGCSYSFSTKPGSNGNSGTGGNNKPGGNTGNSDNLPTFVVYLVDEDGEPYTPPTDTNITVNWLSFDGFTMSNPAPVDENGKAECSEKLDGEYYITIDGLPSIVGYDPNIYKADNLHPEATITIFNVIETYVRYPGKGNQPTPNSVITFQLSTPYYRFKFTEDNQVIWCRLGPLSGEGALGKYEIESMCNIYNNDANPEFSYYNGNAQYVASDYPNATVGTGGVSSSFTKNFYYVINHTTTENGQFYYYFSLRCEKMKTASYPLYLDLHIRKVPTNEDTRNRPTLYVGEENCYDENGNLKDFGITSSTNFVKTRGRLMDYNFALGDDGYYHVVNDDGSLGGYVFTKIIGPNPVIGDAGWQQPECSVHDLLTMRDFTFLLRGYEATDQTSESYFDKTTGEYPNKGNPNAFTEEEMAPVREKGISYFDYCKMHGIEYYPLTEELRVFFQHYCTEQMIFADGDSPYETDFGYVSDHENMWKIFCYTIG